MKNLVLNIGLSAIFAFGCSNAANKAGDRVDSLQQVSADSISEQVSVLDILSDFPKMTTTAKTGEHVLVPSYGMLKDFASGKTSNMIFYTAKMVTPGENNSKLAFTFDGEQEIPNHLIIPIAAGEKVKKGDVVLTWWQSGSGMQRAVVVDDRNPEIPIVHYLDIAWDNPANTNGVSIGQLKEPIKANTFTKIKGEWEPGTTVAALQGTSMSKFTVIHTSADKVLVRGFAGSMKILDKSACTPLPVATAVKVGDKVQAPWVGNFRAGTVKEVKQEYGRAVIVFDDIKDKEYVIPFGDITTGLLL